VDERVSWQGRSRTGIIPINNRALDRLSYLPSRKYGNSAEKVPGRGIEPRSPGLRPGALPLSEPDRFPRVDSNTIAGVKFPGPAIGRRGNGSRAWTRTRKLPVQSRTFYRLKYP
jgi:hypothetical protein